MDQFTKLLLNPGKSLKEQFPKLYVFLERRFKKNLISSNDCVFLIFIWTVTIKTDSELIRIWLSGSVVSCHRFSVHSPGSLSLNSLVIFLKLSAKIRSGAVLIRKNNTGWTSFDAVLLNAPVGRGGYNGWETRPCGKNAPVYSKRFTGFSGTGSVTFKSYKQIGIAYLCSS